jgi:hypothetical protein
VYLGSKLPVWLPTVSGVSTTNGSALKRDGTEIARTINLVSFIDIAPQKSAKLGKDTSQDSITVEAPITDKDILIRWVIFYSHSAAVVRHIISASSQTLATTQGLGLIPPHCE